MAKDNPLTERQQLEQAIAHLQSQRPLLGEEVVDAALAPLQTKLDELAQQDRGPARSGERRVVTALFCDVVGSTALAEGMDPEAWAEIMNAAFDDLIEPVERYGGIVARFMGDGMLAFFGAPTAHEDDPQRAVLAGLAIIEKVRPFAEKLRKDKGLAFAVRVGINTGLAVVGDIGSETAAEYTAMGDAVNLAARMEQTAQPGTVQIAHDTYTLVAPLFECRALGAISVKGKRNPIPAYRVLAYKASPGQLRGLISHGISSPLVGREQELAIGQEALNGLRRGQGALLLILGEAGIGKTRLLQELKKRTVSLPQDDALEARPFTWLDGHTLSYGQPVSYWPFQEMLRSDAGISQEDGEAEAWRKLEARVRDLFAAETDGILPYLASLLVLEVPEEYAGRVRYLDGETLGRQIYRASRRFFQRLAERGPLVLVFDDVHWMDASSSGLLQHLLPLVERVPLLICCLSRPQTTSESEATVSRLRELARKEVGDRLLQIELAPLSRSDSGRLVHNLLDIDGLPAHIRQLIIRKADGNPFFLEEIVRAMIEAGALVHEPATGRWRATPAAEGVAVPDTIQGLLVARIDRLDDDLKSVLRLAAVIGRTFLLRILAAVLTDVHDLAPKLEQLQRLELIREKRRAPEHVYTFKHALAQQAAYDTILLQERRRLHARVGAAIEALMTDRLEEFYAVLAYHYSAAERWQKAQDYLFKAGDQAGRMAADAEALAHYRQAMEAYVRVRGDDWEPLERARLERKIGEALYRLGEHQQARPYLERALGLLDEGVPASRWGVRLAILGALLTQARHRLFPRRFVQAMDDPHDATTEEIFIAARALGWVELATGIERYFLVAVRALNACERGGFAYGSAHLAASMAPALSLLGWKNMAERYFALAAGYARQVEPYRPVFTLEVGRAAHHNFLADFDKSLAHARRAVDIAGESGALREWGSAMLLLTWAHYFQGRLEQAAGSAREMIRTGEEGADRQVIVYGLNGLGTCQKRLGQLQPAIESFQRAIRIARELPDYGGQVTAGSWLARCYVATNDLEQALSVLAASQQVLATHGVVSSLAYLGNGQLETYLACAEKSSGAARQAWLAKAKRAGRKTLQATKRDRPARIDTQLFRGRYEWLRDNPRTARKWWRRALGDAQAIGDRYGQGTVHLEIGRRLEDREHLQRAVSIFEDLGAAFDLTKARKALASLPDD